MNREHYATCTEPRPSTFTGTRGDLMQHCVTCGRVSVAAEPEPAEQPEQRGRYWLGCARCGASMWFFSQRARVPVCEGCNRWEVSA